MVSEEKWNMLKSEMLLKNILESDIEEKFVLVGGKGGQKANKSAVAVQIKHVPSGTVIKSGKTRSREDNRFFARRALLEKLAGSDKKSKEIEKIRKNKARNKRRSKD